MKYIKTYEDNHFIPEIGDSVYCINNNGVSLELELGKKYTVSEVWRDRDQFRLKETDSRWMSWRFTTDPTHPIVVKSTADKYNI